MRQIEKSIALPVRQIVNPARMSIGMAIVLTGMAMMAAHVMPLP